MKSIFEEMGGTYHWEGDYLIPDLDAPVISPVGIWGQRRLRFLRQHRHPIYVGMLLAGTLNEHLTETEAGAQKMMETLIQKMAAVEGITEELKGSNQMKWVGHMNNIRSRAMEIVFRELIHV